MNKAQRIDWSPQNQIGNWWQFMGYACAVSGISYQCPALKLYGYRDDLALHRAVRREIAKRLRARKGA